jgi:phosphotriesterase-related protein
MTKKPFLLSFCLIIFLLQCKTEKDGIIMTVNGPVSSREMGVSLIHEHILVDFIGADSTTDRRWNKGKVIERAMPFLKQIKDLGCQTLVECTPEFLGRDPLLLKSLSGSTGLNILTNTGYYGAVNNKYIPQYAFTESADQLAARWILEWDNGIDGTGIKPGFIKIGVASGNLSDMHKKLVTAAARTHLKTGLTIASHTGPAIPAFEQLEILKNEGVNPDAFIWVHAQAEKDMSNHIKAARTGAWRSGWVE